MIISPRDRQIVQVVARFRQLSASQISTLLFHDQTSRTPCDRALRRLVEQKFLGRVERRTVGGARGGSGVYVYVLGRRGFYQYFTGRFSVARSVDYHCLAIVDAYIALIQDERAGLFELVAITTEPDCWQTVGGVELHPDMYAELKHSDDTTKLWLEIDMGTEGQRQLRGKLEAYYRAYENADTDVIPVFPRCLWVAVDVERAKELEWLISQMPSRAQLLFKVTTAENLSRAVEN